MHPRPAKILRFLKQDSASVVLFGHRSGDLGMPYLGPRIFYDVLFVDDVEIVRVTDWQ